MSQTNTYYFDRAAQGQPPRQKYSPNVVLKKLFWKISQISYERNFDGVLSWILAVFKEEQQYRCFLMTFTNFWRILLNTWFKEIANERETEWMERALINDIAISLYGFIYPSVKRAYCSLLSDFGYQNESVVCKITITFRSEKLATLIWIFPCRSRLL